MMFRGVASDMRLHDWEGGREFGDFHGRKPSTLDEGARRPVGITTIAQSPPNGFDSGLEMAKGGPRRCGDMLDEQEFSSRLEHAHDFADGALLIHNAAKHECADYEIDAGGLYRQIFRNAGSNIDMHSQPFGLPHQVLVHVPVRFDADPANCPRRKVAEICARAGADFDGCSRKISEELGFVWAEVVVSLVPVSGHEPREYSLLESGVLAVELAQCLDYNGLIASPP